MLRFILICLLMAGVWGAPTKAVAVTVIASAGGVYEFSQPFVAGSLGGPNVQGQSVRIRDGKIDIYLGITLYYEKSKKYGIYARHGIWGEFDLVSHGADERVRRGDRLLISGTGYGSGSPRASGFDWLRDDRFELTGDGRFTCIGRCELVGYDRRKKEYFATGITFKSGGYSIAVVPLPATAALALLGLAALGGLRAFGRRRSA